MEPLRNPGPPPRSFPDCAIGRHFAPTAGSVRATRLGAPLITPHDIDGPLPAVASRNGDGLRGAALHIGTVGRCHHRWKAMRPIPGNILGVGVTDVARDRLVHFSRHGFAMGRPIEVAPGCRPERLRMASPVMPDERRAGKRMRRGNPCTGCCLRRPGECVVRRKHQYCDAEGADKRPIYPIRHGTHPLLVTEQAPTQARPTPSCPQIDN